MKNRDVRIPMGRTVLNGAITIPADPVGGVVFAHGSGSGRTSPRNRYVAETLNRAGLATLLFDLLTAEEEAVDEVTRHLRFDIGLLADRLVLATDWLEHDIGFRTLRLGYFGASTGAAAALIAAARLPNRISAVVSRGGRPDLARAFLRRVRAPTLLIVGGRDPEVLRLNEEAESLMIHAPVRLFVIPGATHLFQEPGALEHASSAARDWLLRFLGAQATELTPSAAAPSAGRIGPDPTDGSARGGA
jgi:putative phosphoribosyl transferase